VEVRVLGPIEVWQRGRQVHLARRQQRLVLGVLSLEANRMVSCDRLIEILWGTRPPKQARAVVQTRVSELRATLAAADEQGTDGRLDTIGSGYVLRISPGQVDAHRFRQILQRAGEAESDERARELLRTALALHRGPVLGGWLPDSCYVPLHQTLESARLTAMEDLFEVELRLGNHHAIVDELFEQATANPARERLIGQLMLTLQRVGRTAEALHVYERNRRWLSAELGIDPGQELQERYLAILRGTPASAPDPPATNADHHGQLDGFKISPPHILPPDIPDFAGRAVETTELMRLLVPKDGATVVVTVAGPAGVGKTALCVHVAHELWNEFPDGQLFADLRGIAEDNPIPPMEVLGRFLRALGVEGQALPDSFDDRVNLYRSLLAERRVLVVLDNVASVDQVSPLLPGGRRCATLVNSRVRLGAPMGAETLDLGVFSPEQADSLLRRIAGAERIASEPEAATDLASLCDHLPLALRIAGAKLAAKRHWSVRRLVELMADERRRLDHFAHGQLNVRASLELSYAELAPHTQQLLRRIGDMDLPEANVWMSAALMDASIGDAEEALEELYDAQLVDTVAEDPSGHTRYRLHDLVRLFARERAELDEPVERLRLARQRGYGVWLFLLEQAVHRVFGKGHFIQSPAIRWELDARPVDRLIARPMEWFDTERHAIVAAVRRAALEKNSTTCWALACTASPLLQIRGHYDEWYAVLGAAEAALAKATDPLGRAILDYRWSSYFSDRSDNARAREFQLAAGERFQRLGHRHGVALSAMYLAMIDRFDGDLEAALDRGLAAARSLHEVGDFAGESTAWRIASQAAGAMHSNKDAEYYLTRALAAARAGQSRWTESNAIFFEGMLFLKTGRQHEAMGLFSDVLIANTELGDRNGQASAKRGMAQCLMAQRQFERADTLLHEALDLVRQPNPIRIEDLIRGDLAELARLRSGTADGC
jgi:DNA-binding SARP family transcriptional activator